jgi:hypothetical protein
VYGGISPPKGADFGGNWVYILFVVCHGEKTALQLGSRFSMQERSSAV